MARGLKTDSCRSHHRQPSGLINRLNGAELTIKMNERLPVRLKADISDFAAEHGMLPDFHLSNDFAIEDGECIDQGGDTTCHSNPLFLVKPLRSPDLG